MRCSLGARVHAPNCAPLPPAPPQSSKEWKTIKVEERGRPLPSLRATHPYPRKGSSPSDGPPATFPLSLGERAGVRAGRTATARPSSRGRHQSRAQPPKPTDITRVPQRHSRARGNPAPAERTHINPAINTKALAPNRPPLRGDFRGPFRIPIQQHHRNCTDFLTAHTETFVTHLNPSSARSFAKRGALSGVGE